MQAWLTAVTFASALGSGLIAGVFFAFSAFVMKALGRIPPAAGLTAMQSINVVVINPLFMAAFLGTAAAAAAAAAGALLGRGDVRSPYVLAGGALYLAGTFGVTILFNVPLNNALAGVTADAPDAAERWNFYARRWTAWNHVRTAAALAAMASFVVALRK